MESPLKIRLSYHLLLNSQYCARDLLDITSNIVAEALENNRGTFY